MKRCCTCRELKTLDQYTRDRTTKDGLRRRCRQCDYNFAHYGIRTADTRTPEDRFWSKVDKSGECWIWQGTKTHAQGRPNKLYGVFSYNRKSVPAHRFAYEITYGPIPKELFACHHCDNPLCVRPDHIFPGTPAENTADMIRKGRQAPPVKHRSYQKFTPEQVLEVVRVYREEEKNKRKIAERFGVAYTAINDILRGKSWSDVTGIQLKARRMSETVA